MRFILGSIAALLFLSAPARAAEPVTTVPYRIDYNGWLTVEVAVNGEGPYDFIIDTGATQTLVFQNLADAQPFPPTGGELQTVLGLTAQQALPPHDVGAVQLGHVILDDLVTVILPDWSVEHRPNGIIGLDLLTRYICVFDAEAGLLRLYAHDAPPPREMTARWKSASLKATDFDVEDNILYTLDGKINGRDVKFLLDLGASGTVVNRSAVAKIAQTSNISVRIRTSGGEARERIIDSLEKSERATRILANRLKVGRQYWYRRVFSIYNAPIFDELGVQNKPFGLFGADLIRDRSFMLDFQGEEIRFGERAR